MLKNLVNMGDENMNQHINDVKWFHSLDLGAYGITKGHKSLDLLQSEAE